MAEDPRTRVEILPLDRAGAPDVWAGPELREYAQILVHRIRWIVAVFVFVLGAAALFSFTATPMYRAETLLLIERSDPQVIDIKSVVGEGVDLGASKDYYNTQYEILGSRMVASASIAELGLERSERFLGAPSAWARLTHWLKRPTQASSTAAAGDDAESLISAYLGQLRVEPVRDSRLVRLYFESADPELASRIANTHAHAYIRHGLAQRARASSEAGAFLQKNFEELQERVTQAQEALSAFRKKHGIVSVDDRADVAVSSLDDMNQRMIQAQAERIAREADMRLIRRRSYETLPAVINSQLIRTLKEELAPLEREYAAMTPAVTSAYSGLRALRARIEEARHRLDVEIQYIVEGIESDYLSAKGREDELRTQVEHRKKDALKAKDESAEYELLKQNVQTALELYKSVQQRSQETGVVAELASSNVSVVDASHPPRKPARPSTALNLVLGGLLGVSGGLGLALLLELFTGRVRTRRELERLVQLPILGLVPDLDPQHSVLFRILRACSGGTRAARAVSARSARPIPPLSPAAEDAYRTIRTELVLVSRRPPPHVLLLSSAGAGEGKTTTAVHLAQLFARLGEPVLLLDADLRQPRCHERLQLPLGAGLSEALLGSFPEPTRLQGPHGELFFLGAGKGAPGASDLLGCPQMGELLGKLRGRFQYIVIDGPALSPRSDALILSAQVDGVILVADLERTRRDRLKLACQRLMRAQAHILGIVLNRGGRAAAA